MQKVLVRKWAGAIVGRTAIARRMLATIKKRNIKLAGITRRGLFIKDL